MVVQIAEDIPTYEFDRIVDQTTTAEGAQSETCNEAEPQTDSLGNLYDRFLQRAASNLGTLVMAGDSHEVISVQLNSGHATIYDYGEGVFGVEDLDSFKGSPNDLRAYRLRCVAATAAVHQTAKPKVYVEPESAPIDNQEPEDSQGLEEYNLKLKGIVLEALTLHFELRSDEPVDTIKAEIEEHFNKLIALERSIHILQRELPDIVLSKTDERQTKAKEHRERSEHRIRKLQAVLFRLSKMS